ncbi:hypothetical protein SUGI_0748150 [Cryptomeria japonica]|nr:hypothetical protein SUGI_0748150 [Cryptomeria japonica]
MQISCTNLKSPKEIRLDDPNLKEPPLCMTVIEPQYMLSGNVEVLLAVNDYLLVVDEDGLHQQGGGIRPLQKMVVSPYRNQVVTRGIKWCSVLNSLL